MIAGRIAGLVARTLGADASRGRVLGILVVVAGVGALSATTASAGEAVPNLSGSWAIVSKSGGATGYDTVTFKRTAPHTYTVAVGSGGRDEQRTYFEKFVRLVVVWSERERRYLQQYCTVEVPCYERPLVGGLALQLQSSSLHSTRLLSAVRRRRIHHGRVARDVYGYRAAQPLTRDLR